MDTPMKAADCAPTQVENVQGMKEPHEGAKKLAQMFKKKKKAKK